MRIILATLFVIAWLTLGHYMARQLVLESEFLTSLSRTALALIWIWAMWILIDLILDHCQKKLI